MIKKFLCLAVTTFLFNCSASEFILSNNQNNNQSFDFPIDKHSFYIPLGRFFVGAAMEKSDNDFAIAAATRIDKIFKPLTPKKVTLNNKADENNPLNGAQIKHLALAGGRALTVKSGEESTLYVIDDMLRPGTIEVFKSPAINDANGLNAFNILSIASTDPNQMELPEQAVQDLAAFVAVSNQSGEFDGNGSGLALLLLKSAKDKEKTIFNWSSIDAQTGTENGNKAAPIAKDTAAIKINSNVASIGKVVDMYFDKDLGRLYIALQVQGGPNATDGARAIVVASVAQNKIIFQKIAPDSAFDSNNKIVGGIGSSANINISKVRTMYTRTHLRYLILVGGNGDTKKEVYALPVIDNVANEFHGTLAKVTSLPINIFSGGNPSRFQARVFYDSAVKPADLYTNNFNNSPQARVGTNLELPSDITDIAVINDAVFVSVAQNGNNNQSGIFVSQALFDQFGRIKGWTKWQRATGSANQTFGFALDFLIGSFWSMPTENSTNSFNVLRTVWSLGKGILDEFISKEFPQQQGGVQGLSDFPINAPGLSNSIGERMAFFTLTGLNKVVLVQSGADENNIFKSSLSNIDIKSFSSTNGKLDFFSGTDNVLSISGGALGNLGPIGSSTILSDGTYGWLLVGGINGLVVLANPDGSGWNAGSGLAKNFSGLLPTMEFKSIGSAEFKDIRKLVAIGNSLFVLTSCKLIRITISANAIANNSFDIAILAQISDSRTKHNCSFSDVIISGPLALLATSEGLLRSGNGVDIKTVDSSFNVDWTQVLLPESAGSFSVPGPVSRLFAISSSGFEQDVATLGGNIYLLNAYVGYHEAQVYRLSVQLDQGMVTNNSVLLLPDLFISNKTSFFVNLGNYRNYLSTDGALIFVSRSAYGSATAIAEVLPHRLKSGQRFGTRNSVRMQLGIDNARSIGLITRNNSSGSFFVYGDFGLRINE